MGAIKMRAAARILTSTNGIFSKTAFIASTIAIILGLFFAGHVGLVALYREGATDEMKGIGNS